MLLSFVIYTWSFIASADHISYLESKVKENESNKTKPKEQPKKAKSGLSRMFSFSSSRQLGNVK